MNNECTAFKAWLKKKKVDFNFDITEIQGQGLGLGADGQIAVPYSLFLSSSNIKKWAKLNPILSTYLELLESAIVETERLVVMLFLVYCKTNDSEWDCYVNCLTKTPNAPMFWETDSDAYKGLFGTGLDEACAQKHRTLTGEFSCLQSTAESAKLFDYETYVWADYIFWSRCMSLQSAGHAGSDDLVIVPLVDFCNHSNEPNASWKLDDNGMVLSSNNASGQLLLSYGTKSNSELVFLHGFCIPNNLLESLSIPAPFWELMDGNIERIKVKSHLLKQRRLGMMVHINLPTKNLALENKSSNGILSEILSAESLLIMLVSVLLEGEHDLQAISELHKSEIYPILLLRVATVLQQICEHHGGILEEKCNVRVVQMLRDGLAQGLKHCQQLLQSFVDTQLQDPQVLQYLA